MADPITLAISDTVEAALDRALANHRPRYALTYAETADRLGCSVKAVSRLVCAGLLEKVPYTDSVTLGSLRRLVALDDVPPDPLSLVDPDLEAG